MSILKAGNNSMLPSSNRLTSLLDTAGNLLLARNLFELCQWVSGSAFGDGYDTSESSLMMFNSLSASPLPSTSTMLSDDTLEVPLPKVPILFLEGNTKDD
jgi:hypothetical protein